ncbi:Thiopurine S-methyltransferase (TPMT) [Synechococcus sp. PCC 7502]|uniref:methyltransferase domain-containing protein n=1 Tax=Synechococcus sp. PCC 7502 TaxID=1173263 RepID=UPI00029F92F2|nr:methyltransferase domain-containing protein [Synechococcus sp. PCC 7502]AFY74900.1 Thiopurine S-methyltransferase (TPMT) [Synechococcus sp. PCC 7502]
MSQITDSNYWEQRYQEKSDKWDIGQAGPPFINLLESSVLTLGKVAVIGCGRGHDALLFAKYGFDVTGFDFSPSAIADAKSLTDSMGLTAKFLRRDIFDLDREFLGAFDYVVEHTCFCAIAPSQREDYVKLVHSILKPQGELIALFWAHNRIGGPPFGSNLEEIDKLFSPRFNTSVISPAINSIESRQGEEYLARFQRLIRNDKK